MKKLFMLFPILMVSVLVFGQDGLNLGDIDINALLTTLSGLAAGSVIISALFIKWFKATKSWVRQVISWLVPIALMVAGNLANLGFMAEFTWLMTFAYGLGAGLVSNGIFDIGVVQSLLVLLGLKEKE